MSNNRRLMRNLLLNRSYQLRYTAIMVAISVLLTTGLGIIWYRQVREASTIIEVKALGTMTSPDMRRLQQEIRRQDRQRLQVLVGFGVLLVLAVTGYGIVLTHKVAGPIYKISQYMNAVREGRLEPIGDIRKGDQLHEFFDDFRRMHDALRDQTRQEAETLEQAIAVMERHLSQAAGADVEELQQRVQSLHALQQQKVGSLGQ